MKNILFIVLLLIPVYIYSQVQSGIIEGRVLNKTTNEPVEFAAVAVYGTTIGTLTDENGYFKLTGVEPGYVEIAVSAIGFEPFLSSQLMVVLSKKSYIEIKLNESVQNIEAVVVKASPFRRDIESPISLRNIGIKEIERNPGGNRDISRVVQSLPGVAISTDYRNDLVVRGGGASENRFYIDDVEIPNLNHFATQGSSGGPTGIINVDFVRQVDFYSGAFPSEKGNALSSVLDIKLIDGNSENFVYKTAIGSSDFAFTANGPISKNSTLIFSARRSYLQFLFKQLGLPFLPTYNDFQIKTKTKIDNKNEFVFLGIGAIDNSVLNLDANETEAQRYLLSYLPTNNQWNYTLGTVYRHFGSHSYTNLVVSRNMLYNTQLKYANNIESDENLLLDYNSFESENKIRIEQVRDKWKGFKLSYGIAGEYARYYNNTYRKVFEGDDLYKSNLDFLKWGIYVQVSRTVFDNKLSVSFGTRADANNYNTNMNNLLNQVSPRISLSYALTSKLNLNANTGIYYQMPSYTTLGYRDTLGNLVNKNNLKYIRSQHIVSGFDFNPDAESKFSVEGFYKYYTNYPFSVRDGIALASKKIDYGVFGDELVNSSGQGRAYGAEILYQNRNLLGANITLSYTYVISEFKTSAGKYVPSSYDNRHLFNILIGKQFSNHWVVGLKWRYAGGLPYTPIDFEKSSLVEAWNVRNQPYLDYSQYNSKRLKAFHQLDIRVDKEFFFPKWSVIGYIYIQNVYNYKADSPPIYVVDYSVPIIPDPDRYTLKKLENRVGGTIIPSLGIILMF